MRPLPRRRHRATTQTEESTEPLARLRHRCIIGACIAGAMFVAAFVADVAWPTLGNSEVIGVEVGAVGAGTLCAFLATTIWIVTQNTEYALSIWKVAARSNATGSAAEGDDLSPEVDATPIDYGHTIRNRRGGRIAG
jgi:hypothetical protein